MFDRFGSSLGGLNIPKSAPSVNRNIAAAAAKRNFAALGGGARNVPAPSISRTTVPNIFGREVGFSGVNVPKFNPRRLNTGVHESINGPLSPLGIGSFDLAELTQKQMDMMGSPYNSPDFRKKEDLWDMTKGMEKKGFFGWGAQEETTRPEFNDYYNQLLRREVGSWLT